MKHKSAIVLAVVLLVLPGVNVFAAPVSSNLASGSTVIYPTFVITAVDRNNYVEIQADNLPAGENFFVTMGVMGSGG